MSQTYCMSGVAEFLTRVGFYIQFLTRAVFYIQFLTTAIFYIQFLTRAVFYIQYLTAAVFYIQFLPTAVFYIQYLTTAVFYIQFLTTAVFYIQFLPTAVFYIQYVYHKMDQPGMHGLCTHITVGCCKDTSRIIYVGLRGHEEWVGAQQGRHECGRYPTVSCTQILQAPAIVIVESTGEEYHK